MTKSPAYPKYERSYYNGDEYNPHADFSLFLEEAKRNERIRTDYVISQAKPEKEDVLNTKPKQEKNDKRKKKKAWKAYLLPWWKAEKKSDKSQMKSSRAPRFGSGPVFSSSGKSGESGPRRPLSGPLMSSLFNPIRKAETEIRYVCLTQLGSPCPAKNYGPVYLVT